MGTTTIRAGMEVYGSDNQRVGTIGGTGGHYFQIDGRLLYPLTAVARIEGDTAYLFNPAAQYLAQTGPQDPAYHPDNTNSPTAARSSMDQRQHDVRTAEMYHRAGLIAGMDARYAGKGFEEVEPELRQAHEQTSSGTRWDDIREEFHEGWNRAR